MVISLPVLSSPVRHISLSPHSHVHFSDVNIYTILYYFHLAKEKLYHFTLVAKSELHSSCVKLRLACNTLSTIQGKQGNLEVKIFTRFAERFFSSIFLHDGFICKPTLSGCRNNPLATTQCDHLSIVVTNHTFNRPDLCV